MKRQALFATTLMAIAIAFVPMSFADTTHEPSNTTKAKQAGVVSTFAVAGAAAGGPIGLIVGGLSGKWMADNIERADRHDAPNRRCATMC